jgi:hypothetical protein
MRLKIIEMIQARNEQEQEDRKKVAETCRYAIIFSTTLPEPIFGTFACFKIIN